MPLINDEFEPQPDIQRLSLQQALNVLMPIRRQRLNRAQRLQRQQQAGLQQAQTEQQAHEEQLVQDQQHYQQQRERLQQQSSKEKLTRHLNNEMSALQAVGQQQQQCHQAERACEKASFELEQATQWAREQQKAVEKLEYLSEHLEEA
ncbi:type III secretion system protein [Erwinia psidii]|uniref:Type III secretion system protein n=1 Tax=Erwinia psidii TaxID=69224 RepID=A0A3N6SI13_9GAMM|nr:type III secretion system protein [Erwinia psidii]RQM39583.1 type III secretion system protein [Erwinia psidii]